MANTNKLAGLGKGKKNVDDYMAERSKRLNGDAATKTTSGENKTTESKNTTNGGGKTSAPTKLAELGKGKKTVDDYMAERGDRKRAEHNGMAYAVNAGLDSMKTQYERTKNWAGAANNRALATGISMAAMQLAEKMAENEAQRTAVSAGRIGAAHGPIQYLRGNADAYSDELLRAAEDYATNGGVRRMGTVQEMLRDAEKNILPRTKSPLEMGPTREEYGQEKTDDAMRSYYRAIPYRSDFDYERYQMGYIPPNGDAVLRAMTDTERAVYKYLGSTQGTEAAEKYYAMMKPEVEQRQLARVSKNLIEVGKEHPVAGSALSVMLSVTNNLTGGAKKLYDAYKIATDPEYEIDPYDQMYNAGVLRDALREGAMQDMNGVGRFLYQTGMSAADSTTNALMFGGTGAAAALGTGAMADTAREVKLRGGTDEQALGMGIIAGAAELLTEKMGFGRLGDLIGGTKGNVFRAVLGHMTSEFGEEAGTEIANLFADWAIMQDKSQYAQMVEEFGGGEEGTRRAWWEMLKQVGLSGLGGALSGAAMGGSSAAIGRTYQIMQDHTAERRLTQAITKAAEQAAQNETAQNAPVDVSEAAMQVADRELGEETGAAQAGAREAPAAQMRTEAANQTTNRTADQNVAEAPDAQKQQYMDTAQKYGEKYGDGAALVFARNYDGGDIQTYDRAFNALYTAGRAGLTLDKVGKVTDALTAGMSDVTKRAILQAGANSAMSEVTPGVRRMYTAKATDVQKRQIAMLNEIGRKYGVEIDVVDSIRAGDYSANGMYTGGRKIVVALDAAEGAIVQAGVHELTHYLKRTDTDAYNVLRDVVLDHLGSSGTFDLELAISERMKQYAGQQMTREDIIEEIVSEAVPTFLTDEKAVKAFVSENRPLAQKIRDFFVKFAQEIREIAERYMQRDGAERYEIANLLGRSDALTEIARTFDAALEVASEAQEAEAGETVYAKESMMPGTKEYAEAVEFSDINTSFSLRTEDPPKKTIIAYKAFYARDGKLYPPMVANITDESDKQSVRGATSGTMKSLETPVGVWLNADVGGIGVDKATGEILRTSDTGRIRVENEKGGGTLAFRPGWHLGEWPDAKQFNKGELVAYTDKDGVERKRRMLMPDDLVFAKCEIAADIDYQLDAMSYGATEKEKTVGRGNNKRTEIVRGYERSQTGLPYVPEDGFYKYRTNVDPSTAPWYITGAMKVVEILDDDMAAEICAQYGVVPDQRVSGKKINLADYGLQAGPVKTTEDLWRFKKNQASYDNDALLERALNDPNYADAYVSRPINFDDPNVRLEFEINNQDVEYYRAQYEEREAKRAAGAELTPAQTRRIEADQPVSGATETKLSLNSPAFRNWFGESKIVNEDGSPKVMYHGTDAYNEFTIFKKGKRGWLGPGIYLSASKSVAESYARKNGYDGRTYALYAKVDNPLVVTEGNPVPEILRAVSGGDRLYNSRSAKQTNDVHLITSADVKKLQAKGYDGIIWQFGNGPIEVSVFSPTQIKSATDNIGTYDPNNPDIRFSLSNTSPATSITDENQNLSLPVDVNVSEESVRAQARKALDAADNALTERMKLQIRGIANKIMRETGSSYSKETFAENMEALVRQYAEGGWTEDTLRAVTEMAKKIIETSERADNSLREQYADVRKRLKESGVALTETQKQEAANISGGYGEYRKSVFGTVNLKDDGMTLESLWGELSEQHPEIFTPGANEGDQVRILQEFAYLMRPKYENPYGMDMDGAALEMAMRIEGDIMGMIGAKDAAKAMYGSVDKLRSRFEQEYKAKLKLQKAERVQKFQQIAADLKAAKAKGDSAEQAKIMSRYRTAMKSTGLDEAYAEIRATLKAREEAKAENARAHALRERVIKRAEELEKMFRRPEKGKRIPTGLQGLVLDVLETLDINGEHAAAAGKETKKAAEFREKLTGIRTFYEQVMNSQSKGEAPEGLDGLMMAFTERNLGDVTAAIDTLLGSGEKFRLRDMDSRELHFIESLLNTVKHTVDSVGKLWKIHRYQNVAELAETSIEEMSARGKRKNRDGSAGAVVRDFLALDMMEPLSYGERLGEGGSVIVQALMDGEKEKFAKIREAAEATAHMMNDAGINGYDVGKWRKHIHTIKIGDGHVVKMTDVEVMELYVSANRPQGLQHLLGGGMVLEDSKRAGVRGDEITLTQADIAKITQLMNPKQKKIADMMQTYLSGDVAKWGNDVTQRMYLYDAFTERMYWPISSDSDSLKTSEPERDRSLTAITNAGITKTPNENANNAIIIGDIFDTFNKHIGDMASYAGYAEVMTDALAWFNYRQKAESGQKYGGVKKAMRDLLGEDGISYLTKLLQDINGARRGGDGTRLDGLVGRTRKAAVVGKIRVALQQPTSIVRAAAEINPIYLIRAMKPTWGSVKEMQKYSSLAWWKSNGNYEIGVGKSTDAMLWGDTDKMETAKRIGTRAITLGLDPGKLDDMTWSRIWEAAKLETKRRRKDLKVGSEEYFKAVAERFEAICDRTQVVDTVMHRSDIMRSKDGNARNLTAFMGEPIKSYNMLMRSVMEAGRNPKDAKAWGKLARTGAAYVASVAATSAATALFDALKYRDDDDPLWEYLLNGGFAEDWTEQWLKSFMGSINPAGNIVLVKDIIDILNGGDVPTVAALEGIKSLADAIRTWTNFFGEDNSGKRTWYGLIKPTATAVSNVTGLPLTGLLANAEMLAHAYDPKLLQTKSDMQTMGAAYDKLYRAMLDGNKKETLAIRTEINKGLYGATPKNDKEIDTGIAEAMALSDERILKAWKLKQEGKIGALVDTKKDIMKGGFTDAQVTKAFNSVESYMTSEYRSLLEEGKTEEAGALKAKAAKYGMELTEKPEKDMEKELEAKTLDYKSLFAAIRSGDADDIGDAVEILIDESDAKTEEGKEKAVRNEVSEEFREEYIDMVRSGKTKDAEKLAEALEIVGFDEEDRTDWVKKSYREDLKQAVTDGDMGGAKTLLTDMRENYGMTDDSIADTIRGEFKQQYIDLVVAGKDDEADALAEKLMELGLKYKDGGNRFSQSNLNKWVTGWEKAQDEE